MKAKSRRQAKLLDLHGNAISGINGQLMVMAAHRYCLGRRSYIVSSCIEWLKLWWPEFEKNTRNVIVRDTIMALQDNSAGSKSDFQDWKNFAEWAWNSLDEESKASYEDALLKRGTWPLEGE